MIVYKLLVAFVLPEYNVRTAGLYEYAQEPKRQHLSNDHM